MPLIRSISGIRATLGDSLFPESLLPYFVAFAEILPDGPIAISRDGRPSGKWIEHIAAGVFASMGRDVHLLGMAPTPTAQYYTEFTECSGGISITASHNPSQWNGVKFIAENGVFLNAADNARLFQIADSLSCSTSRIASESGTVVSINNAVSLHVQSILSLPIFNSAVRERLQAQALTVVVDAVNASGSVALPQLLRALGCNVIELYCDGSGIFPHMPEPLPIHLTELARATREHKADLGIAIDPDADRLVLIDGHGDPIGEERTIVLASLSAMRNIPKEELPAFSSVVVNLSTTMAVEVVAQRFGALCERTPVGEINVVNRMQDISALIGGEGSGGVILPIAHYGRDSLVGVALILADMANANSSLSELNAEIPSFPMTKTKLAFTGDFATASDKLSAVFAHGQLRTDDGIHVHFGDSWVHIRASNTEPIVRIIAESESEQKNKELIDMATKAFDIQ